MALATHNICHHDCQQQAIHCCVRCRQADFVDDDPFLLFVSLLALAFFVCAPDLCGAAESPERAEKECSEGWTDIKCVKAV